MLLPLGSLVLGGGSWEEYQKTVKQPCRKANMVRNQDLLPIAREDLKAFAHSHRSEPSCKRNFQL